MPFPLLVILDVVALSLIAAQALFSSQMIRLMKKGMLERSWWYLSTGSIVLAIGIATFIIDGLYDTGSAATLFSTYLGTFLVIVGSSLTFLGILSQYQFWSST
ncbi:MAG: hypothetical protein QXX17_07585 [Conexivisphaerales archaeon]